MCMNSKYPEQQRRGQNQDLRDAVPKAQMYSLVPQFLAQLTTGTAVLVYIRVHTLSLKCGRCLCASAIKSS